MSPFLLVRSLNATSLEYAIEDGKRVSVRFESMGNKTKITETFEPYPSYTEEQERSGWQAILDNFKRYAEDNA